jgi:hypothetical protein
LQDACISSKAPERPRTLQGLTEAVTVSTA